MAWARLCTSLSRILRAVSPLYPGQVAFIATPPRSPAERNLSPSTPAGVDSLHRRTTSEVANEQLVRGGWVAGSRSGQARPGTVCSPRQAAALICCRGRGSVAPRSRGPTAEARRAWGGRHRDLRRWGAPMTSPGLSRPMPKIPVVAARRCLTFLRKTAGQRLAGTASAAATPEADGPSGAPARPLVGWPHRAANANGGTFQYRGARHVDPL